MAIYYARANGNVNATNVWSTSPSGATSDLFPSFTNQDTLMSNGFTVTLNVNTTILEVRTDTTGGATAGGGFTLNSGVTLNANAYAGTTTCVTFSSASPSSATINGNIYGSSTTSSIYAVLHSNTGTLTINGSVNNGTFTYGYGVGNTSTGTLTIIGNINATIGTANNSSAVLHNGGGVTNITGTVTAGLGGGSIGVYIAGLGTINITGNVIGNGAATANTPGILNNTGATVNITGNVTGGSVNINNHGATNAGAGTINITGTVTGGLISSCNGVANSSIGTVNIIGTSIGGPVGPGASNSSTGTMIVTRAKGNSFGPGSVGVSSTVGVSAGQTSVTKVYEIQYGDLGQSPTSGPIEMISANSNVAVFAVRLSTPKTLVDLNNAANLVPSSGNVRNGVSYNYGNNTGSCVIPNPNSVVYGVPVDNTVGSGLLSPVAVWNALTSSIGTSGSIGERLNNCSTVSIVGKQLEGVL